MSTQYPSIQPPQPQPPQPPPSQPPPPQPQQHYAIATLILILILTYLTYPLISYIPSLVFSLVYSYKAL
ncbi:hypothetical protein EYC84_009746 [Monilinia fructicola]|uniref:Uncharacterized protein n=1 Tax=Monilinia fructicola TaxID=38448 RepID=A0A5M9JAY8_MONFR|nr:hypothetical protein EYC84_009746 [Monilinia fructicola]